jgi:hypothetical protein
MKLLRRRKPPDLGPGVADYLAGVAGTLRDAERLHGALPADRDALLAQARESALAGRGIILLGVSVAEVPAELTPYPALRALERITCSLVAHAQSPPDPTGALRPGELGDVIGDDVRWWMAHCRRRLGEGR